MISPPMMPSEPGMPAPLGMQHKTPQAGGVSHCEEAGSATMAEERLPFSVRVVSDEQALEKAVFIRHAAYARHVPDLARTLQQPEAADFADGAVVLLAESHLDGAPLGTMRIQTNRYEPLALEQSLTLPPLLSGRLLAEATRLGVAEGRVGTLVKTVLFKAFFLYCQATRVEWMVVAGRAPVDRQYMRLLFDDVYPELGYVPLRHASNLPHRVMKFEVGTAQARWAQAGHPLFNFIFRTRHPDIQLDAPQAPVVSAAPVVPAWVQQMFAAPKQAPST
ncbi:hypothetical protein GCM10022279_15760 [Comamonas faecalis]|uniref:Long-chain N-acyl amino acid synthase n=1 Tax=Comamonas faecalis TaxID=1387849 RepID=A0ABP7R6G3_9BURK